MFFFSLLAQQRSTALKVDWVKVTTSLGLRGQTVASLQAFKKRNDDARRKVQALSELPTTVDFAAYRAVLKNAAVVDEIEKRFAAFKPATYDVSRQLKAIDAFEVEAVRNAEATKQQVDLELQDLEKTLKNIDEARPFEDLTVDEVAAAEPSIDEKTAKLVSKGRWSVPGYKVRSPSSPFFPTPPLPNWSNNPIGEVWRPGAAISAQSFLSLFASFILCTLARRVDMGRLPVGPWTPGRQNAGICGRGSVPASALRLAASARLSDLV